MPANIGDIQKAREEQIASGIEPESSPGPVEPKLIENDIEPPKEQRDTVLSDGGRDEPVSELSDSVVVCSIEQLTAIQLSDGSRYLMTTEQFQYFLATKCIPQSLCAVGRVLYCQPSDYPKQYKQVVIDCVI